LEVQARELFDKCVEDTVTLGDIKAFARRVRADALREAADLVRNFEMRPSVNPSERVVLSAAASALAAETERE
jgi:hypothetical protein